MISRAFATTILLCASSVFAQSYDYVIVGGGTAGLTLAGRLTENSNLTVVVLEAGGDGIGNENITDLRNRYLPYGTEIDWAINTLPQASAGGRVYTHRQGKVLGGSSAMNGAVQIRPDTREFETYQSLGATGWTWETFLTYFKKSENFTADRDPLVTGIDIESYHGTSGPVDVSFANNISSFFSEYAIPAVENMNQEVNADNCDGSPIGAAPQQISVYPDTYNRSYSANAYYFPVQDRTNLVVYTDSLVSKILWADDQDGLAVASGVEYISSNGSTLQVYGDNVIVSAGTLNTPKILELSGVGDPSILSDLGIDVKVNSTGVGKNLQNQLGVNVIYKLKEDSGVTLGSETQAPLISLLPLQTVLSEEDQAVSDMMLQEKNEDISQAQFEAMKGYIVDGLAQTEINWSLQDEDEGLSLQFYTTDLHTFSRGYAHANSSDPTAKVTVDPKYLSSDHDLWYLSRAIAYTRNITSTEPLASIIDSETTPGANYSTSESLQEWLLPNFKTMSHFVGTAAAIAQEDGGVVDPTTFIVFGTSNVRVVDASVIPLLPGIHTQSIVYAIAEWAADILKSA
ncbi:alcohol oxidase [Armillaria solidipes]|uniref:Alcohol oxidase n=1 Tax=Armillaria solidipes TaxID=1076256 RepID=A0A2H3BV93_9AGAR|nr:alcohol oxidase [Armillaria solidipes]